MQSLIRAAAVIAVIGASATAARGDVAIATDPVPPQGPVTSIERVKPAVVAMFGFGIAHAKDIDGDAYVGRLEVTLFPLWRSSEHPGAVVGFGYGVEYWRSGDDNWGLALPAGLQLGARVGPMHGVIGFGVHAMVIDEIDDDTGVGAYAPYASAVLGFHLGKATIAVDGRIDHRFLYDAPDRTQWSLGIMVGATSDFAGSGKPIR